MKRILMGFMLMPFMALATTVNDGLVAWYKFDGDAKDSSGNGNDGVVHGATLTTDRFGNVNGAMYLGWGNWIQVADSESLHSCTQDITLVVWARVHECVTYYPENTVNYITKGAYGYPGEKTRQFGLAEVYSDECHRLSMNDPIHGFVDEWIFTDMPCRMATNVWRQVVMTYDGMVARSYINGISVASSNIETTVGVSLGDLYIGMDLDGGVTEYCNADVDDIRIYNRALSAEEVELLYTKTLYVNGTTGSDENYGTSPTAAKKTIQAAIDASVDGDTILVAPGTYAPFVAIDRNLILRSEEGSSRTVIDADGRGRCATLYLLGEQELYVPPTNEMKVIGFTLQHGRIGNGVSIIGRDGAGVCGGTFENCVFKDNTAEGTAGAGAARCAVLKNCLLCNNSAWNGGGTFACDLYNCTVVGNEAIDQGGGCMAGHLYNTIVADNRARVGTNLCNVIESVNIVETNPHFVDAASGDYRLAAGSPCIDAGNNSYVVGDTDLEGCGRIVNGTVDIGCYEFEPDGGPYVEKVGDIDWTYRIKNGRASVGDGVNIAATNLAGAVSIPSWLRQRPVSAIDEKALFNCKDVTSVTIPEGVKDVGSYAFGGCGGLKDIYIGSKTLASLDADAFKNCNWDLIVHVPADWQGRGRTLCGYTVWKAGSSDEEKSVSMSITNTVVQYVLNSVQPEIAVPVSGDTGFVAVITEVTSTGAVSVPIEWRDNYPTFKTLYGNDFGKSLMMKSGKKDGAGNEMFVWQDYVAGTDPTDLDDKFTASITMVGDVPVISYSPELTAEQAALRVYKTWGKKQLKDEWTNLTDADSETMKDYNFFKVTVQMK